MGHVEFVGAAGAVNGFSSPLAAIQSRTTFDPNAFVPGAMGPRILRLGMGRRPAAHKHRARGHVHMRFAALEYGLGRMGYAYRQRDHAKKQNARANGAGLG